MWHSNRVSAVNACSNVFSGYFRGFFAWTFSMLFSLRFLRWGLLANGASKLTEVNGVKTLD
jgi:hypothetical protein